MGGGDKCLIELGGRTLPDDVIARARPQVRALLLNANGDSARFRNYRLPVAADAIGGFAGPLAAILTAMEWAQQVQRPQYRYIASFATDTRSTSSSWKASSPITTTSWECTVPPSASRCWRQVIPASSPLPVMKRGRACQCRCCRSATCPGLPISSSASAFHSDSDDHRPVSSDDADHRRHGPEDR